MTKTTTKTNDITTRTARAKLAARREPYWHCIQTGLYVGYRARAEGEGTWIARRRDEHGKQQYRSLGHHESLDSAQASARQWAQSLDAGALNKATTVKEACAHYARHLEAQKGEKAAADARGRFKRLVDDSPVGRLALDKLQARHVRDWLNAQVDPVECDDEDDVRRAKDSANRNLASLKAALNLALKDRLVATDAGWKTVGKYKSVGRRREAVLTADEIARLLDHLPGDLRALTEAMAHIPSRPGELASLRVCDFDRAQGTLALTGKTGRRVAALSTAAIAFLSTQTSAKLPGALLFAQAHGPQWDRHAWKKPFRAAARAAGLPDDVVLYSLRHAAITNLVQTGADSALVAKLAGTSVAMIEAHYLHTRTTVLRAMLDAAPPLVKAR